MFKLAHNAATILPLKIRGPSKPNVFLTAKSLLYHRELESACVLRNEAHGHLTPWASVFLQGGSIVMASSKADQGQSHRVSFDRDYPAHIMAIDGTWRRGCILTDVSDTDAQLTVESTIEGLSLKEFFLLLSSPGLAYRRCELSWVNGDQIGVSFLKQKPGKRKAASEREAIMDDFDGAAAGADPARRLDQVRGASQAVRSAKVVAAVPLACRRRKSP